jgi:RNA polymerase sigma factor (sigma-70 family)
MEKALQDLLEGCIAGNPVAQKKLFDMYASKMLAVCNRYMSSLMEAEDVLQEGFIKMFNKLVDYKMEGSFDGWLRRIMVNTALDNLRARKKMQFNQSIDDVGYRLNTPEQITSDINANDLMTLVQSLPTGYKTVFNMFAIEGYSHKEIAEQLGITENTSKSQYSRAREYLRKKLELVENEG